MLEVLESVPDMAPYYIRLGEAVGRLTRDH
jgi:hypothetical protein